MAMVPLTRRQLLTRSFAGMAWALPQQNSSVCGQTPANGGQIPANERIEVAVIGAGARGREHLKTLLAHPEARVAAIVDVDENHLLAAKRLVAEAYGQEDVKVYEDYRELIAAGGVDAAVIAVPNHWHALIAIACAKGGIDIYGETPLAHTIVEGRAICRAVKRYGRVWQTGSHLRSDPAFQRACRLVASGRLGTMRSVEIGTYGGYVDRTGASEKGFFEEAEGLNYDFWLGPAPWLPYHPGRVHENWRWHQGFGGGQLMSWIGHYGDIALWALGLDQGGPRAVKATGEFAQHEIYSVPTRYDIEASFSSGLTMHISSSLAPGIRWRGDEGWIYVTEGQVLASSRELLQRDVADGWATQRFTAHGHDHWQDFLGAIRTRGPTVAPCESGQRAASIGHLGMLALNTGSSVSWDPENEVVLENRNAAGMLEIAYREPWMLTD